MHNTNACGQVRQEERERAKQRCRARDSRAARNSRARKVKIRVIHEGCHKDHLRRLHALHLAALKEAQQAQVLFQAKIDGLNCALDAWVSSAPHIGLREQSHVPHASLTLALRLDVSYWAFQEVSHVIRQAAQRIEADRAARVCKERAHARQRYAEAISQVDMGAVSSLSS